jgi:hypothetical protein
MLSMNLERKPNISDAMKLMANTPSITPPTVSKLVRHRFRKCRRAMKSNTTRIRRHHLLCKGATA